jgi:hypothetical protein
VVGVKSRTAAVHAALREIVALKRFKKLMSKYAGKLEFSGHDDLLDERKPRLQSG